MNDLADLSETQLRILSSFYKKDNVKVSLNKNERSHIWDKFLVSRNLSDFEYLKEMVPALFFEIAKAISSNRNIQSAVFSECVYTKAIADQFGLIDFHYFEKPKHEIVSSKTREGVPVVELNVRYAYSHNATSSTLYQAGGASGVDCALKIPAIDEIAMIELKESYARASDPNLPKYGNDGRLVTSMKFEASNPQFREMLQEQITKELNIFDHLGSNINDFSAASIEKALTDNYQGSKFAHVICTEDINGYLVMLPSNHVTKWAKMEGEIRPSGRNSCKAWSILRLTEVLLKKGAEINGDRVVIPSRLLKPTIARGGNRISRYRIDPIFFVRERDIKIESGKCKFYLASVKQNIPSITAKMNFELLDIESVRKFYMENL